MSSGLRATGQMSMSTPACDLEAEFDARCWTALAAFKKNQGRFIELAREIVAERPLITIAEFVEYATKRKNP
jgi:hypothetical protein